MSGGKMKVDGPRPSYDARGGGVPQTRAAIAELLRGSEDALLDALEVLAAERGRRATRRSTPEVLDYAPAGATCGGPADALVPEGAVTVFFAPAGAPVLDAVRRTFADPSDAALAALAAQMWTSGAERTAAGPRDVAGELVAGRTFAELHYGSETLAEYLALPNGLACGALAVPYDGRALDDAQFVFTEFLPEASDERLEVVLVRRAAVLTDVERAALALAPAGVVALQTATFAPVAHTTVLVIVFALAMAAGPGPHLNDVLGSAREDFEARVRHRLDALGPTASAGQLLALRQELYAAGV